MLKIIKILILILIFLISIFSWVSLDFLWIKNNFLKINSNFEFSKVLFFNIFSSIIIILFFFQKFFYWEKITLIKNKFFYIFYFFLVLNTFLSYSFNFSFFWNPYKGHSFLMINNLFLLFIIFSNLWKNFSKKIIFSFILWTFFTSLIAIKEYYFPSFDYKDLSNRAFWSFWHPNLLSIYLLISIIFLYKKIFVEKKYFFSCFLIFIIFALLLTKSALAIFIFILFNFYFFLKKYFVKNLIFSKEFLIFIISFIIFSFYFIYQIYPEKLSSFISRFFIWKTTLEIIFSNIKIFIFWWWIWTIHYFFWNFKSPELYIFENIWFNSDRAHNIFLQIFYNFWIIWLGFFIYFLKNIFSQFKKNIYFEIFLVFLIFNFFNFSSISSYLIIVFIIYKILEKDKFYEKINFRKTKLYKKIFIILSIIFSIISLIFSFKYYKSETYTYKNNFLKASEIFPYNPNNFYALWKYKKWLKIENFKSQNYFLSKIINDKNLINNCEELVWKFPYWENYFFCWENIEKFTKNKKKAFEFYKKWLKKLPDLWNKNSIYYKNFLTKNFIQKQRFLNKKFSNLKEILEKLKIK